MTDRAHSLTVVLEQDTRDDCLDSLTTAIRQLRGVVGVELNVADHTAFAYEVRAEHRTSELMIAAMKAIHKGGLDKVLHALEGIAQRSVL